MRWGELKNCGRCGVFVKTYGERYCEPCKPTCAGCGKTHSRRTECDEAFSAFCSTECADQSVSDYLAKENKNAVQR